jgi:PhnB protein
MASSLNPYIGFKGDARQAMEFYQSVFGGTLNLTTFGEFNAPDPAIADQIMHADLQTPAGYRLMGSDTPPGMPYTQGDTISVSLSGDDAEALRGYWQQLSEGATVSMPLEKQAWGDEFGLLTDRFGVNWMVNITQAK